MLPLPASRRTKIRLLLADGLSPNQVAARLRVSLSTVYRWRDQPLSSPTPEKAALRAAHPEVLHKLISLAKDGDLRAIKEVLSRFDEIPPDPTPEELDSEHQTSIMMRVIEHELDLVSPLLASNLADVWIRVDQHLAKVLAGELPVPPPVNYADPKAHPNPWPADPASDQTAAPTPPAPDPDSPPDPAPSHPDQPTESLPPTPDHSADDAPGSPRDPLAATSSSLPLRERKAW